MKKYLLSICIMGRVTVHCFPKFHPSVVCGAVDTRDPLTCTALNSLESRKWLSREGRSQVHESESTVWMFPCAATRLGAPATLGTKASTPSRWEGAHEAGMSSISRVSTARSLVSCLVWSQICVQF